MSGVPTPVWVKKLYAGTALFVIGTVLMILPIIAANKGISVIEPAYSDLILVNFGWTKYYEYVTDTTSSLDNWTAAQGGCGWFFLVVILMNVAIGVFLEFQLLMRCMGKGAEHHVAIAQKLGFWIFFWQILATVIFEQVTIGGLITNGYSGSFNLYLGWAGILSIVGACLLFLGILALGGAQGARFTVGQAAPTEAQIRMAQNGQAPPTIISSGAATSQQIGVAQPMYGTQQMYGQPGYGVAVQGQTVTMGQPVVGMPMAMGQPVTGDPMKQGGGNG